MAITRINEFQAKEEKGNQLWELLQSVKSVIKADPHCQDCQMLRNHDDPTKMVVIEIWDSVAAHQASTQKIPVHLFEKAMRLVVQRPTGGYYHE